MRWLKYVLFKGKHYMLTQRGLATHMRVGELVINDLGNYLSPARRLVIN